MAGVEISRRRDDYLQRLGINKHNNQTQGTWRRPQETVEAPDRLQHKLVPDDEEDCEDGTGARTRSFTMDVLRPPSQDDFRTNYLKKLSYSKGAGVEGWKLQWPISVRGGTVAVHGYGMAAGTVAALFGWYVIHSNKDASGKPHFTTVHGKVGLVCLVLTLASAMAGSVLLDPDFGLMKPSKVIRRVHKYAGRGVLALAAVASLLGWWTVVKGDPLTMLLIAAPLPALGWTLL
ncbi:unnamed protein product [Prorocentrum cordatum]|uniref:Cytochrome b561 domain-containing protein n=1 Tax=Prorocentrum cordatum TaxID=2364126 RepID=A0ABN9U4V5_9DINO|nr:unnamed protein product [Polarella glacialis]